MTLKDYIDDIGGNGLAERLGCSKQLVSHWRTGRRRPSGEWAVKIESASGGAVSRRDIRPDLYDGMAA